MVFVGLVTSGITSAGRGVQTLFKLHSYYMELIMDHECCYEGDFFQYCFSKVKKSKERLWADDQTDEDIVCKYPPCSTVQQTQDINGSDYVVCAEGEK